MYAFPFIFTYRKYIVSEINHTEDNPEDPQELSRAGCSGLVQYRTREECLNVYIVIISYNARMSTQFGFPSCDGEIVPFFCFLPVIKSLRSFICGNIRQIDDVQERLRRECAFTVTILFFFFPPFSIS